MKLFFLAALLLCSAGTAGAVDEVEEGTQGGEGSPLNSILGLLDNVKKDTIKEGEEAQKIFEKFAEYCSDRATELGGEIKMSQAEDRDSQAIIDQQKAIIEKNSAEIEQLAGDIAGLDKELNTAKGVRDKANKVFKAEERDLMLTEKGLKRVLRELQDRGVSDMQMKNVNTLMQTFSTMLQASVISTSDASKLTAFLQANQESDGLDEDSDVGAPAAAAVESESGGVVSLIEDLLQKASSQLDKKREAETKEAFNYEQMRNSLSSERKYASDAMDEAKQRVEAGKEAQATASGELTETLKELRVDADAKDKLRHECTSKSQDYEDEMKARAEEIKAVSEAAKVIKEALEGASLEQVSFVQMALKSGSRAALAKSRVVKLVRDLGHSENSNELMQLASKIARAATSSSDADPLRKVKQMIVNMITKLEKRITDAADHKAYCDKELGNTKEKKTDKKDQVEELETKEETTSAKATNLKSGVAEVQKELSLLMKSDKELTELRQEGHDAFEKHIQEVQTELDGTKQALAVLKKQVSSPSNGGTIGQIVTLLEDIEAKLSNYMGELKNDEQQDARVFTELDHEIKLEEETKEQDITYKTKDAKGLDKSLAEIKDDEAASEDELGAVSDYYQKILKECQPKKTSAQRKRERQEKMVKGLQQALDILESEASLLQLHTSHRTLRGARMHRAVIAA